MIAIRDDDSPRRRPPRREAEERQRRGKIYATVAKAAFMGFWRYDQAERRRRERQADASTECGI